MLHVLTRSTRSLRIAASPLIAVWLLACVASSPPAVAGPFLPDDPRVLDRALVVATQRGYRPEGVDRVDGTFYVTARADLRSPVTFEVRCTRDGWVIVVPRGERVLDVEGGYRMRTRLRDEYLGLVAAFERGIEVRQEEDGVPIAPWEKP